MQPLPLRPDRCASDEGVLLFATPTFALALGFNRMGYSLKVLLIDDSHRSSVRGVAAEGSCLMLSQSTVQAAPRGADVIGATGTLQDVKPSAQYRLYLPHPEVLA